MLTHNLGYPRIGRKRELKFACEKYWAGEISLSDLNAIGKDLRQTHWQVQRDAGIQLIPCNDFSFYDHVLDMTQTLNALPQRFAPLAGLPALELYFALARGYQKNGHDLIPLEMTKWFDTNYHYLVPEFHKAQTFSLASSKVLDEFQEARDLGINAKPVLIGPVSYLLLGKEKEGDFHRLQLLERMLPVYQELLTSLSQAGAGYVQLDEPFLALDLDDAAAAAYRSAYSALKDALPSLKIILATYFEGLHDNIPLAVSLPVHALHVDLARAPQQLDDVLAAAPPGLTISLGLVNGRNVWNNELSSSEALLSKALNAVGAERLMVAPSCSLLHVPVDATLEEGSGESLPQEIRASLSFARQKLGEVAVIAALADPGGKASVTQRLKENAALREQRAASTVINNEAVRARMASLVPERMQRQSAFPLRQQKQQEVLQLPLFPITTIGSFPQTAAVRKVRSALRKGDITEEQYTSAMEGEIARAVRWQEEAGIDMLVHGEFERTDMVEYFGEQLQGCAFTQYGWVQSYGSRCVKPPLIYGDVARKGPMTVRWSSYAQSLTRKPMKGMLTGPVTILQWSFVRDDQPRRDTALQIALALADEVADLEQAGLSAIQIDEPALREGLPLRRADREGYLRWAVEAFRVTASGVRDETQIHTHMCYAEFNDIMADIAAMDADVITIETSRSQMELLEAFKSFRYPNGIGPGVYDVHSARVPTVEEMSALLKRALYFVPRELLWVNPDCGLKTRGWEETKAALLNMVRAARRLREECS